MNKCYRIVWNAAHNTFIVTNENAKAKGTPSSTRKIITGALSAAMLLGTGQTFAVVLCTDTVVSAATTNPIVFNNCTGGSLTVNAGGNVIVTPFLPGDSAVMLNAALPMGAIVNNGTISGLAGANGIMINNSTIDSLTNNGTISSVGANAALYQNSGTINFGINNTGTITSDIYGIALNGTINGGLTNSGIIAGTLRAINVGGTLDSIHIAGNNTAQFVGEVSAPNTPTFVDSGASYTMNSGQLFTVLSFTNNGNLAVDAGATGTITGDYSQGVAATFQTKVTNDTTYGKMVVTGLATLPTNAKIDVNVSNPNFAFTATSMASIISAGTLSWDGTSVVTDNSVLFDFTASKNGNAVDLNLAVAAGGGGGSTGVMTAVTNTGNTPATGVATVLDGLVTAFGGGGTGNADMDAVIGALGGLTTNQQVSNAVSSTLPLMTGGMAQATSANLHGVNHVIQARMEENRGLSSGDEFVGNRKAWLKPLGSWANQNDTNGVSGYKAQTYGVALGADTELSQVSNIGAAFATTHSSVNSNSAVQSSGVNSYQAVLYGSRALDERTELNWAADYGYNQNKGNRYIAFVNRSAAADYTSSSIHLGAGIGRTMPMSEKNTFTPSFRADYTSIKDNGYVETGAGALNLVVNGKTTGEFILAADGKITHTLSETSTLTANLGVGYDTQAKQSSITAAFQGGGAAFTTSGIKPSATLVRGGLGMSLNTSSAVEITARYDFEGRTGYTGQTASVKFRMPF